MPAPGTGRGVRRILILTYIALTLAGLFLFHGIPLVNVAMGFPLGAAAARRSTGTLPALQAAFAWAMTSAAITMAACWLEFAGLLVVTHYFGPHGHAALWLPLRPPTDSPSVARIILFSAIIAPALQVLTTSFGGLMAVLLGHSAPDRDA